LPRPDLLTAVDGECLLFVDGLRLDLARNLAALLEARNLCVEFGTRIAALPAVTPTAKPAASPIADILRADILPDDFRPADPDGKALTSQRFNKLLQKAGISLVDMAAPTPASDSARGWGETGKIDSRGHDMGAGLARVIPEELDRVAYLVVELLAADWKSVRVVTDHGWLLLPGGLPKFDLPGFLVESRWTRCAKIKGESVPDAPTVRWHWNPAEHVVVAPGACSFKAGVEYSHGGISPQECILPVLTIRPSCDGVTSEAPRIVGVKWKRLRCNIEVANTLPGLGADVRRHGSDSTSTVCASIKEVEPDGQVSLLVTDESLEGETVTIVLLSTDGQPIAKTEATVGA